MRILFCGLSGFPDKSSAPKNRYMAIAQAMAMNNEIIFLNRIPILQKQFEYQSIKITDLIIIEVCRIKYRPSNFLFRNLLKLSSFLSEFLVIYRLNMRKKIDWVNVYTQYFGVLFFYYLLSKVFNFKIILHYVEYRSKIRSRNILYQVNDYLFDRYSFYLSDSVIPISTFLNNHILRFKPNAKTYILPPICDFDYFDSIQAELTQNKYFLFCGSASYDEILLFIIKSYLRIVDRNNFNLYLVLSGKITNSIVIKLIEANKDEINIFSGLTYDKLISKYKGAEALLIPVRNTFQDCARFPQKICEYMASRRPIITTNFGEIPYYFVDKKNAIVASEFNTTSYSEKLNWAINNPKCLNDISNNSYYLGLKLFDIKSHRTQLEKFLKI
ncbi:MAG: glycosyltransferase family 4 protein [Prolixibacteraceae bacterium]|nr:glycosyltransferase family 4 protein [Prolixibacteraceae bacterium]